VLPWNTPVLLCAGSKRYSQIDLRSLVVGDPTLSFSFAVLYPVVHKLLCESSRLRSFVISNAVRDLALCAKHVRQLGDESSLSNLMEVKD
jgi:hypothetical protein